jgi:H+/gluconate symporter-like permease
MTDGRPPERLPPRDPHPLSTHVVVDVGVVFLATLVVGLILGIPFLVIVGIAIVAGVCLAPYTRRTEERQLAERARDPDQPS